MELEAAKMIGAGLAGVSGSWSWYRNHFWELFIWCNEKSIGSPKAVSKLTFGICFGRSYRFIWIGNCINNFICLLIK